MPGGRPTDDPKGALVAVRLASRQLRALEARARREHVSLSEALRRCVDEWATLRSGASGRSKPPSRAPTAKERKTFDQLFAALGLDRPRREPRAR